MTESVTLKLLALEANPCEGETDFLKCYPKLWKCFKTNTPIFVTKTIKLYHWFQNDQFTIRRIINKNKREILFEITGIPNLEDCDDMADWHELINYELVDKGTHEQCDEWTIFQEDEEALSVIKLTLLF